MGSLDSSKIIIKRLRKKRDSICIILGGPLDPTTEKL